MLRGQNDRFLAMTALVAIGIVGCGSEPVPAPTSYSDYSGKEKVIVCQYPEGWEADGGGNRSTFWAKFTKDTALIRIDTDLTGSLLGTIDQVAGVAAMGDEFEGADRSPAGNMHEQSRFKMEEKYGSYEEQPGTTVRTELGDAWQTEFAAKDGFGRQLHGYRATVLGHDLRFTVVCCCNESDWDNLKSAFEKSIVSLDSKKP